MIIKYLKLQKLYKEISALEGEADRVDVEILRIIQRLKPELVVGMDVFVEGGEEGEEMDEDELRIEGEPGRENRTIFREKVPEGFSTGVLNTMALTSSFKWSKITEWKRFYEDYEHEDQELQVVTAAEGALKQVFGEYKHSFKVNKQINKHKNIFVFTYNKNPSERKITEILIANGAWSQERKNRNGPGKIIQIRRCHWIQDGRDS